MIDVPRETQAKLVRFKELVVEESERQNLVSSASLQDFDARHIADGAQLVDLGRSGSWCDIGSGAGLPGVVIAILSGGPVALVEPRKLRAAFLRRVVTELQLDAEVIEAKAERVSGCFDNITARAVADIGTLFAISEHLSHSGSRWILPKGRSANKELAAAEQAWQGRFTLVRSKTSDEAAILVAEGVRRRGKR